VLRSVNWVSNRFGMDFICRSSVTCKIYPS